MFSIIYITLFLFLLSACGGGGGSGGGTSPSPAPTPTVPTVTCTDSNATNNGSAGGCVCPSGYFSNADATACLVPSGFTYASTFSSYAPIQSATTACAGTVTTNRTVTCQRSDGMFVASNLCAADPSPTSTVQSKAGTVTVTPSNSSLSNGHEEMTCAVGATTGTRVVVCDATYQLSGATPATQTCTPISYTYTATYSSYAPVQLATTACAGTVTTNRTISSCVRNPGAVPVATSFCSDSSPTSTVQSKSGSITVTPTNSSLTNGSQTRTCAVGATTGTEVVTCNATYHVEGTTLSNQNCFANVKACSSLPTGTTAGTQTWDGTSAYGSCVATTCAANYTLSSGVCYSNSEASNKLLFQNKSAFQIMSNNTLKGWGMNEQAQLGLGDTSNKPAATLIPLGLGLTIRQIYTNGTSSVALLTDGTVKSWGSNAFSQLGVGDTVTRTSPTAVNLGEGVTAKEIIVGGNAYCAILNDDTLSCWGKNSYGELGQVSGNLSSPTAVNLGTGRTVKKVIMTKADNNSTCAILDDDTVRCFGYNGQGQLGDTTTTDRSNPITPALGDGKTAKDIMFFSNTATPDSTVTCAILNDDSLSCWGYNANGRLGVGDTTNKLTPTATGLTVKKVYGSMSGSLCAILSDSTVKCWGQNNAYQVGDTTLTDRTSPVAVTFPSAKPVKELVLGNLNSNYAIHTDGTLSAWGNNFRGQLGVGSNDASKSSPNSVTLPTTVKKVVATSDYVTCVILTDLSVSCAGDNTKGSLGTGSASLSETSFATLNLGTGRTALEVHSEYYGFCSLLDDSSVKCWGDNDKGKLAQALSTPVSTPTAITVAP